MRALVAVSRCRRTSLCCGTPAASRTWPGTCSASCREAPPSPSWPRRSPRYLPPPPPSWLKPLRPSLPSPAPPRSQHVAMCHKGNVFRPVRIMSACHTKTAELCMLHPIVSPQAFLSNAGHASRHSRTGASSALNPSSLHERRALAPAGLPVGGGRPHPALQDLLAGGRSPGRAAGAAGRGRRRRRRHPRDLRRAAAQAGMYRPRPLPRQPTHAACCAHSPSVILHPCASPLTEGC